MGSSSSRLRRRRQQQELQQEQQLQATASGAFGQHSNGQLFGGYAPPQQLPSHPHGAGGHRVPALPSSFAQSPLPGARFGQPPARLPPPVPTAECRQTATVKNQVNLKKPSLKLSPVPGRPHDFLLRFDFDATAPCRVSTFLLATEEPQNACRLSSAVVGAPPRTPVYYPKGMGLKFPPEGDEAAAEAHVISSIHAPMGHMVLSSGDSFPIVVRLETLTEEGRGQGHTLEELEVGGPFPPWAQAQSTYAKLAQDDDGDWQVVVLKQKIWVNGVSYELQEIYGMEAARRPHAAAGAAGLGQGGPSGAYDELEGRECVICMSADRDTMVLPCRHMCMCQECAAALKTKTSKCPICRNEIASLLHIKIRRKAPSHPSPTVDPQPNSSGGSSSSPAVT